jgi:ubiquitin C-terminal hydrolase
MIDGFLKMETLSEPIMCDKCKAKKPAEKELSIDSHPDILTIHLKRFTNSLSKDNTDIDISPELTIGPFKYQLYAMCNHIGSASGGHYTATCRKKNGFWIVCNDNSISDLNSLLSKSSYPYILFYKKRIIN